MEVKTRNAIRTELASIMSSHENIEKLLDIESNNYQDSYLPNKLFQKMAGISQWIFNRLKAEGKLRIVKRSRELWVHKDDVDRYLNGEIQ
jgi:hypothetical protein